MTKDDLITKSPIRALEKALGGVIQSGEIGVITSRRGVGKTSMLVQLGLDRLLQDHFVVHISFSQQIDYTLIWYSDLYDEIAKKKNLEKAGEIKPEIIANRVILNFNQDSVGMQQIIKTVTALIEGGGRVSVIMIDDFKFATAQPESLQKLKIFAEEHGVAVYCTAHEDVDSDEIHDSLKSHMDAIDIVLHLSPSASTINVVAVKNRDKANVETGIYMDSKTMLLNEQP